MMPQIPEDYWKAIVECDPSFNDTFIYAVKTTKIFCKPSCRSREPKRENVLVFNNAYMAMDAGYRPCKRCKPDGANLPAEEWIGQITSWIDGHYHEHLTLEGLADLFHGSPFHLQRMFKKAKGMTPAEYIQDLRLEKAAGMLLESGSTVTDISEAVGYSSTPYFTTLFKKKFGSTPAAYRKRKVD